MPFTARISALCASADALTLDGDPVILWEEGDQDECPDLLRLSTSTSTHAHNCILPDVEVEVDDDGKCQAVVSSCDGIPGYPRTATLAFTMTRPITSGDVPPPCAGPTPPVPPTEVTSTETMRDILRSNGYELKDRDPAVKPDHPGKFMLVDTEDGPVDGYAIVGDDADELIAEAYKHMGYNYVPD